MRINSILLSLLLLGTLGGVLATGCQTYDFEEVEPLAVSQTTKFRRVMVRQAKPNLMMLVDASGSMKTPVNVDLQDPSSKKYLCRKGGTATGTVCGTEFECDRVRCPTRWTSLQDAMEEFLARSGSLARIGLAIYPDLTKSYHPDTSCASTSSLVIPLPEADTEDDASLEQNARKVNDALQAIKTYMPDENARNTPNGGTPTNDSLIFLDKLESLEATNRPNFVLLLTDGLPNCNINHASPYPACQCTLESNSFCESYPFNTQGCLDDNGSVAAIEKLKNKHIKTIVIGFGAELDTGTGARVLNDMAKAGDFRRTCSRNSECGTGDSCDMSTGQCKRLFYQAGNKDELVEALKKISDSIGGENTCEMTFGANEAPDSQETVVVYLNKERVEPGPETWSLKWVPNPNGGEPEKIIGGIVFTGTTCQRLENSTTSNPVDIEVRAVRKQ